LVLEYRGVRQKTQDYSNIMFTHTKAIDKLRRLKEAKKVVQGGTYAGKTNAIIAILINDAATIPGDDITVVAETIPAIKAGALKIFKEIMQETGRWNDDHYNATDRVYTFNPTKSKITFTAFDSIGKAKASGKRKKLFINEANYISFNIAWELIIRTDGDAWIDYNPDTSFWVQDEILGQPGVDHIILTYKDNQTVTDAKLYEFEQAREKAKTSKYWENWCRVYLDGEMGRAEGLIYQDWSIIDSVPEGSTFIAHGLDFGYTNNPSAFVSSYKHNDKFIFDEGFYETGLRNNEIADKILAIQKGYTWADQAEPKSIDEIVLRGVKIRPAKKGSDSVRYGIDLIQQRHFYVTARSLN
jgi:phage terminase large subunit